MTELSPAAQAVLNATNQAYDQAATVAQGAAAALRAAANQVGPSEDCPKLTPDCDRLLFQDRFARWHQASLIQQQLRSIANELEAQ